MQWISGTLVFGAVLLIGCGGESGGGSAEPKAELYRAPHATAELPAGWYPVRRPVPRIIEPRPILAAATTDPRKLSWNRGGCTGFRDLPAGEVGVSVIEYREAADRVDAPTRRPGTLRYSEGKTATFECSGHGTMFVFRRGGHVLQAHVAFSERRLPAAQRRAAMQLLNTLRAH